MTKLPNIADIIAGYANQDRTLQESAADLGAMILEMDHEEELHGAHSPRLAATGPRVPAHPDSRRNGRQPSSSLRHSPGPSGDFLFGICTSGSIDDPTR